MTTIRQVLCATDLSPAFEAAWEEAQLLATVLAAELVLLHVLPPPPIPFEGFFPPGLYATDFSPTARAAWPWVVGLAEPTGATVDLLHVTMQPVPGRHLPSEMIGRMTALLEERGHAEAERFLQQSGRIQPGRLPRERVEVLIGRGGVEDQIAHWAQARGADLIVMGTHGWSGLLRWMLGSVAHYMLQTAPCPVLTVGPEGQGEGTP